MRGIRQQHQNAMTGHVRGEAGDFGVESLHAANGGGPSMGPADADLLSDSDRGIGHPVKRGRGEMPAQAHPDHGPHHHR
jgi:hypothetical protein